MNNGIKLISLLLGVLFFFSFPVYGRSERSELIQMAILLDTSGSMDGLIDQAKSQLWKIVNELALAKKNGKSPVIEVSLYEYGKQTISSSEGYLRMVVPLTTDLDQVSEELFKLKTNGGEEYCGMVIKAAVDALKWSNRKSDLKVIVIAGNEAFSQGKTDYKGACKRAVANGIIVNTIFCGNHKYGIDTMWKHGAELGNGKYMSIEHNKRITHIKAPQDEEIVILGRELNKTYIAYGVKGEAKKRRQRRQDENAASMDEEVLVQRSIAKASRQYVNSGWDLGDAVKEGSCKN